MKLATNHPGKPFASDRRAPAGFGGWGVGRPTGPSTDSSHAPIRHERSMARDSIPQFVGPSCGRFQTDGLRNGRQPAHTCAARGSFPWALPLPTPRGMDAKRHRVVPPRKGKCVPYGGHPPRHPARIIPGGVPFRPTPGVVCEEKQPFSPTPHAPFTGACAGFSRNLGAAFDAGRKDSLGSVAGLSVWCPV
jgi:hypothetical protein